MFLAYQDDPGGAGLAPLRPEGVLVELGRWGGSQPHETREVTSVLAAHGHELGLPESFEFAPVTINVVDPPVIRSGGVSSKPRRPVGGGAQPSRKNTT